MSIPGNMDQPVEILLVEDNPVDVMIAKEAFKEWRAPNNLHVVRNGEEAMDFLRKLGKYSSAPSPDIVFLDLNLPRKDGREVLAEVKGDPSLRHIPVIILTTSGDQEDISRSYQLQANCFITKPADMKQFSKALENLGDFWLTQVRLPTCRNPYNTVDMESIHLLLVEDNPVDALHLKETLEEAGGAKFAISQANTLAEAKKYIKKNHINIVALDLGLSDSRGLETFLEIQKSSPNIPIIVVSGLDDESLAISAVKNGAQDYLIKDKLDSQLIVRCVHYAIQRHQLLISAQRTNRALRVLSECNQLLIRATEEQAFLNDICRILVDHGRYTMAWIGFADRDEAKTVRPVATAGFEEGYLKAVKITWSEDETGRGPTGTAIRTGVTAINRNSWSSPQYGPWRSEALKRGYSSSIALPLKDDNGIFGALAMYANEPDAFDEEEVDLLGQLAEDLSHGINTLRMRAAKQKADFARQESERRFRAIFEGTEDYICIKDPNLRYVLVNPALARFLGKDPSDLVGLTAEDVYGPLEGSQLMQLELRALQGENLKGERLFTIGGISLAVNYTITPLYDAKEKITGIFSIGRDVTGQRPKERYSTTTADKYPSKAMRAALSSARQIARKDSVVLLLGESGSGKDYVAKYVHDHSPRSGGPYFSLNCAAISPHLAESELFGHEKGAFTGAAGRKRGMLELAEVGSLLLNEIGELSLALQAKLLTFLDTRKFTRVGGEKEISVNARLMAATNRELEKQVEEGSFRKDLFYRLNVINVRIPPLRERLEDIPVLVDEIISRLAAEMQLHSIPTLDTAALNSLASYAWPGNVRELRNVLERAVMLSDGADIDLSGLGPPADKRNPTADWSFSTSFPHGRTLQDLTDELTKSVLAEALRLSGGNKKKTAEALGIARDSLYRYMKKFGMETGD